MVSALIGVVICGVFMIGVIPTCDWLDRVSPGNPMNPVLSIFWPVIIFPAIWLWLGHKLSQKLHLR